MQVALVPRAVLVYLSIGVVVLSIIVASRSIPYAALAVRRTGRFIVKARLLAEGFAIRPVARRSVAAVRGLGLFACAERRIRLTVAKRAGPAITVVIWRLSIANDVGVEV